MIPLTLPLALIAPLPLLAVAGLWYALPLVVSITLVCAATRHELMAPIFRHALRFAMWIVLFMVIFGAFLLLLEKWA